MPELLHRPPRAPASAGPAPAAVKPPPSADRRVAKRREARTFRMAMAVVALALIDNVFVHPALGYPPLRPGLRGAAALGCGVLIGFFDRALLARNPRPQAAGSRLSSEPAS